LDIPDCFWLFYDSKYYNSFVELEKGSISFSDHFHQESIPESSTGISFVYSSSLCACHNQSFFKTFKELTERGKMFHEIVLRIQAISDNQ